LSRAALALVAGLLAAPALSGQLVYTPVNPSFGGNPLNSSHLMGLASAQRSATAFDANLGSGSGGTGGTGETPGSSDAELFLRQLQGRLLSALASQVTEAIFGADPQRTGEIIFGGTTISFLRVEEGLGGENYIQLTINDGLSVTDIKVPILVVN
jgi:curli production assembly/transport component CsgF